MKVLVTIKEKHGTTKIESPDALAAIRELLSYISYSDAQSLQDEVDSFVKEGRYEPA